MKAIRASDVCPEIREYERASTASANAYVQPIMARYVRSLDARLKDAGFACPLLLMTSGGGLTTVETAARHPIRLVESGPAGGAILASRIATAQGLDRVLSFDMGGTTAKICLIDDGRPQSSRTFEVDRMYRFTKGSGLPLRIPVIEMVENWVEKSVHKIPRAARLVVARSSSARACRPTTWPRRSGASP